MPFTSKDKKKKPSNLSKGTIAPTTSINPLTAIAGATPEENQKQQSLERPNMSFESPEVLAAGAERRKGQKSIKFNADGSVDYKESGEEAPRRLSKDEYNLLLSQEVIRSGGKGRGVGGQLTPNVQELISKQKAIESGEKPLTGEEQQAIDIANTPFQGEGEEFIPEEATIGNLAAGAAADFALYGSGAAALKSIVGGAPAAAAGGGLLKFVGTKVPLIALGYGLIQAARSVIAKMADDKQLSVTTAGKESRLNINLANQMVDAVNKGANEVEAAEIMQLADAKIRARDEFLRRTADEKNPFWDTKARKELEAIEIYYQLRPDMLRRFALAVQRPNPQAPSYNPIPIELAQ